MARYCPYCVSKIEFGNTCPYCSYYHTYRPAKEHLPPGTLLHNKYLVGRVLGQGGFGITYLGRDLLLDMKVAIKEYFPRNLAERDSATGNRQISLFNWNSSSVFGSGKEQFIQEAQTIAKMDKESAVVTVRDFFEENNSAYIVMEYVNGEDLRTLMQQRGEPMDSRELLPLMEPVFKALDELHGMGLIHRDISPDNIMLEDGRARLIDFGCARSTAAGGTADDSALKHGFSPIEQYENRDMGPWTDVYAMAASIYYCLTGKLVPTAVARLEHDTLAHPITLGAKITPRQDRALMKALSIQPEERFQSMHDFGKQLFVHRNKALMISAVSCALAIAVIGAAFYFRPAEAVETRGKETGGYEILTSVELTAQEREKQRQLTKMLSEVELYASDRGSYYVDLRLNNTTDYDLDALQLQLRTTDSSGTELSNRRSEQIDLKKNEEKVISFYIGSGNFDKAEIKARLLLEERGFETEYCPLAIDLQSADRAVSITVQNELPATITTKNWNGTFRYTITDFRYTCNSVQNGYYVTILLSGTCDGCPENSSGSIRCLLIDKDGAVVNEGSYTSTVSLPRLREGDSFEGADTTIWDIPAGEYTLVLEGDND